MYLRDRAGLAPVLGGHCPGGGVEVLGRCIEGG